MSAKLLSGFLKDFRREHSHLKCVVIEDGLNSNGRHINDLTEHNLRFILGAKPGDDAFLFEQLDQAIKDGEAVEFSQTKPDQPDITQNHRFVNGVSLNKSHPDILVNMLEYWQIDDKGKEIRFVGLRILRSPVKTSTRLCGPGAHVGG